MNTGNPKVYPYVVLDVDDMSAYGAPPYPTTCLFYPHHDYVALTLTIKS